jgi:hypothetical protein
MRTDRESPWLSLRTGAPRRGARTGALRTGALRTGALRTGALRTGALRTGALGLAVALALTLAGPPVGPAAAGPAQTSESAIGAGMISDRADYQKSTLLGAGDGDGQVDVEDPVILGDDVCRPLAGEVSQVDIDAALGTDPAPTEPGHWEYEVCAEDAVSAQTIAAANPTVAAARQHCGQPYEGADICGVYVHWRPDSPSQPPPADPGGRKGYIDSLDNFAPVLVTSPAPDERHGLIVNFPTWFWSTVRTELPKAVPGVGTAWHLRTTFNVDGHEVCRVSGLHKVGTVYHPGQDAPDKPSPSGCGYTFPNQGRYDVRGCTRWLFILGGLLGPFIFTQTFCDDDIVTVKEAQILTGRGPRRHPAN